MCDEQRIFGVHNHKVFNPNQCDKLLGAEDVVIVGVDGEMSACIRNISFRIATETSSQLILVKRSPRTKIVPTELCREAV